MVLPEGARALKSRPQDAAATGGSVLDIIKSMTGYWPDLLAAQASMSAAKEAVLPQAALPEWQDQLRQVSQLVPAIGITVPELARLQQAIGANLPGIAQQLNYGSLLEFDSISKLVREAFQPRVLRLPFNWTELRLPPVAELSAMLLDEGLPLAWVVPTDLLERVFDAVSVPERRRILSRAWQRLTKAAIETLQDELSDAQLQAHGALLERSAAALLDGHTFASQALSANLLDTILSSELHRVAREAATSQSMRPTISTSLSADRAVFTIAPIWSAHAHFRPDDSSVPWRFNRHASVHAVSKRQYTRINALFALLNATALLVCLEHDFELPS